MPASWMAENGFFVAKLDDRFLSYLVDTCLHVRPKEGKIFFSCNMDWEIGLSLSTGPGSVEEILVYMGVTSLALMDW